MRLIQACEHGTRTVEYDEGNHGVGNVQVEPGKRSYAASLIAEVMPRCPYCEIQHQPMWQLSPDAQALSCRQQPERGATTR